MSPEEIPQLINVSALVLEAIWCRDRSWVVGLIEKILVIYLQNLTFVIYLGNVVPIEKTVI